MGNYVLFVVPQLDQKEHGFGHLPTHVPFAIPNNFDGGKEEMSTM
jgi:hypothetical protein